MKSRGIVPGTGDTIAYGLVYRVEMRINAPYWNWHFNSGSLSFDPYQDDPKWKFSVLPETRYDKGDKIRSVYNAKYLRCDGRRYDSYKFYIDFGAYNENGPFENQTWKFEERDDGWLNVGMYYPAPNRFNHVYDAFLIDKDH